MVRADGQTVTMACPAMGTRFELLLRGGDAVRLRSAGEAAIEEITRWHGLLSAFDAASVTSRINREAAERPVPVSPESAGLLRWCVEVSLATGGAFDVAVGHLMRRAGFRGEARIDDPRPDAEGSTCQRMVIDSANRVHLSHPAVALDFGAIGKGWAIDRAVEVLREHGVTRALIHGGTSSITAVGDDNGQPWRVALGDDGCIVTLTDESLGLSAPSGRQVIDASGITHGHILDPRTGRSTQVLTGTAVIGCSAAVCDAWSTALMVDRSLAESARWPDGYRALTNAGNGFTSTPSTSSTRSTPSSPIPSSLLQGSVH